MRRLKRITAGLFAVLVLTGVAGATYQYVATVRDSSRFPMPGERVDVGGRALHLYCTGSGAVSVILENGLSATYTTWLPVQQRLAGLARVCSYDRAGMGFSDASPDPTRAGFVSRDLHALIERAAIAPPYVLVGWSAGGVFVRRYYRDHPDGVIGLVFVDSSHEQQKLRLPQPPGSEKSEGEVRDQLAMCRAIAWTGAVRLSGVMEQLTSRRPMPEDVRAAQLAMAHRTNYCAGVEREMVGFALDVADADGPPSLRDLPIVVLSRGRASVREDFGGADVSDAFLLDMDRAWATLQAELAALSTRSTHRVIADSGHAIPLDDPDAVVAAVASLLPVP